MPTDAPKILTNWELWAAANHYVTRYGENTGLFAAARCDELLDAQDYDGVTNYQAIIDRIDQKPDVTRRRPN